MAELKKYEETNYIGIMDEAVIETESPEIKIQSPENLPYSPKKRLRNVSLFEKFLSIVILAAAISVAVLTIQVRTAIVQTTNDITNAQAEIKLKENTALQLEQEKNELSKADRIKQTAEEQGLSEIDGNLRKVN
ncbi:cell division protein FtsL [Enterococcus sp. BWB1-3]|uniref:cell division protein FtsL n=1 Tax=unclassified Enterococcus TaxID=2608891 RepID=UPI001924A7C0|nr:MULTISPECIES: cell division protein FtsL [unclassified Enterococcus]MBL1227860.1 cell division protein FtsL [Enterococcus sp. BWB1-3]MCB5953140.1 cell division protein FtsL [Enterococcus sp. BWT-B8]MCB5956168.1 cell division protein FtsL [Enterococcus sp. CWB-B31]